MKKLITGVMVSAALVAAGWSPALAEVQPLKMERAGVMPSGRAALNVGIALESDREFLGRKYDNLRLAPFGIRYGMGDSAEVGAFIGFSANSDDDSPAPDESGLEGLTLYGKLALNDSIALQAGATFLGDDDIAPYANDDLDLFVNVPMQRKIGPGLLYGQFGYRVQGGDFDTESYFNFGIGYGLPLNNMFDLNIELVGEDAQKGTFNTLDLVVGAGIMADRNLRIAPYISLGIYDDSPDIAAGCFLDVMF